MDHQFHKIRHLPLYVLVDVNAMKAESRANGKDAIDFGISNPDQPPAQHIIERLNQAVAGYYG